MKYVRSYALYFLYHAGAAALIPFLAIHYKSLGFCGGQIGTLTAVTPLVGLFSGPFWGGFADYTRRHQQALILAMAGVIGFAAHARFIYFLLRCFYLPSFPRPSCRWSIT